MTLSSADAKARIDGIIDQYRDATSKFGPSVVPSALVSGKLYEAWVLCEVLERLRGDEGYTIVLRQGRRVTLKASPGPINRSYAHFELNGSGRPLLELWTDVEFMSLSHRGRGSPPVSRGDFHELDLVVVPAGTTGRPRHDEILIGIECKDTGYQKHLLRAVLGVRRELSLLVSNAVTGFNRWPRSTVPADPPSCLLVYCTDPAVVDFQAAGGFFGIDFCHLPPP